MSNQQPDPNLFLKFLDFLERTLRRILNSSQRNPWTSVLSLLSLLLIVSMLWRWPMFEGGPTPTISPSPSPTVISQDVLQEACKRYAGDHKGYLLRDAENGRVQDPEVSSVRDGDLGVARCTYKIKKQDGNIAKQTEEIRVKLEPQFDDLITKTDYKEDEITLKDLENICNDGKTYVEEAKKLSVKVDELKERKLIIRGNLDNVWPVFRWGCFYKVTTEKKITNQSGSGIGLETEEGAVGMNLDNFCEDRYGKDKGKATHHNYQDPWSLYCT